jgi:hypothetical protein
MDRTRRSIDRRADTHPIKRAGLLNRIFTGGSKEAPCAKTHVSNSADLD